MEFTPNNPIVRLCLHGMAMEEKNQPEEAAKIFLQAWEEATNDFEKYLAAYYVARHQHNAEGKLKWLQTSLSFALSIDDESVKSALPSLYAGMAKCYDELNNPALAKKNNELAAAHSSNPTDKGPFYHGTKAALQTGDLLTPGNKSNYQADLQMNHIYFTALPNGAGLAAALAQGEGNEHVYIVEPTAGFESDPNVTDKKFPGNPTRSYRTRAPLKITGELTDWIKQTPEAIQQWRQKLDNNKGEIIN
jgi:hypothetical protein